MKFLILTVLLIGLASAQQRPQRPWFPERDSDPWQQQRPQRPWRPEQDPDAWQQQIEHSPYLNCPQDESSGRIVYYPYHLNCANFYQCVNGRAVLLLCPESTLWDRNLNFCDDYHTVVRKFNMC